MKTLYYILPVFAGIAIAIQSGINAQLRTAINHPILAAFISFFTGTLVLALLLIFSKQAYPSLSTLSNISWYKFTGGMLGVFVVTVAILSVQQIGAANMFVLIVAGQLITALIMDQLGLLGLQQSPLTIQKLIGVVLLIAGAYLVNRK